MNTTIDLGGTPANEDCAQLGHTPDFDRLNLLEVRAYAVAMQARFGPPPEGCNYVTVPNRHDFGTYRTLGLRIEDRVNRDPAVIAYIEAAQDGLGSWLDAGVAPPIDYVDGVASRVRGNLDAVIRGALATTRPRPDGTFPTSDFETLHTNLSRAFPEIAETFRASLSEGAPA
jgi:hypothetical protein